MEQIKTISQLVNQLNHCKKNEIKRIVDKIRIPVSEFNNYATWNDEHYTRNCIARTKNFELLLLCWQEGQETPVHCHNDQDCWVFLIDGSIIEHQYKKDEDDLPIITETEIMKELGSYYINDDIGLHSLHNSIDKRAMSLHIYVNPIEECSYFSQRSKKFETKKLEYDTFMGK